MDAETTERFSVEQHLTAAVVADRLAVSIQTVRKLERRGELVGLRIGNALRFRPSDVRDFLDRAAKKPRKPLPDGLRLHGGRPRRRRRG